MTTQQVVSFERGRLLFVFNFHPTSSFDGYRVGVHVPGDYYAVLCSDDAQYGGHARIESSTKHTTAMHPWHGLPHSLQVSGWAGFSYKFTGVIVWMFWSHQVVCQKVVFALPNEYCVRANVSKKKHTQ